MNLLERVIEHEGFEPKPYPDPLSGAEPYTFGHGLTYISEFESTWIVTRRLKQHRKSLMELHPWLSQQPEKLIDVVVEMSFQMGVVGVNKFRKMWGAIQRKDYQTASAEMLNSRWANQTPSRARALAAIVSGL